VRLHQNLLTRVACFCLIVFAFTSAAFAGDDADAAIVYKIVAMEKAWNQAFKLRDSNAISALLDDSIVLVNDDGSLLSKADFLALFRESKPSDDEQVSPESISVRVIQNVAVATGVFRSKGTVGGKPYVRRNRFADTWVNKNGNWVCVSASATPISH